MATCRASNNFVAYRGRTRHGKHGEFFTPPWAGELLFTEFGFSQNAKVGDCLKFSRQGDGISVEMMEGLLNTVEEPSGR
jgi:hypothetical protein